MNTIEVARADQGAGHRDRERRVHPERHPDQRPRDADQRQDHAADDIRQRSRCKALARRVGDSVPQRAGRKLREYAYQFDTDSFVAPNMTVLAEHITQTGVVELAYQQEPSQIVWAPRTDGVLTGMTYERTEDVVGWHRHTLGGVVESVVTIPTGTGIRMSRSCWCAAPLTVPRCATLSTSRST